MSETFFNEVRKDAKDLIFAKINNVLHNFFFYVCIQAGGRKLAVQNSIFVHSKFVVCVVIQQKKVGVWHQEGVEKKFTIHTSSWFGGRHVSHV